MNASLTVKTITKASLSANEAASFLPLAAEAAIKGKAEIDTAKAKGAAALAVMVAGFSSDDVAIDQWSFDITVKGAVHEHVPCMGIEEFGREDLAWVRNGEGKVSRDAQGSYKAGFLASFFNLTEPNAAVWTMVSKAVPIARRIRAEGMVATIEDGALKLSGGEGEGAEAMRAAKSLAAMGKVAKGETGTNRDAPQNDKGGEGEGEDVARGATPTEVLAVAARLIEAVANGEEALSNAAASFARKIAALVAANPEAFAEA
jgi:hypothetical protein